MGLQSAKLFVKRMREDRLYRGKVGSAKNKKAFWKLVHSEHFDFNEQHLASAMAECMTEMEESA